MRVYGFRENGEPGDWRVDDEGALDGVLRTRDSRGGNWFDLCVGDGDAASYPLLTICVGGEFADICYTPNEDEPGFRCRGTVQHAQPQGWTVFNTAAGDEYILNAFLVPFETAVVVAKEFLTKTELPSSVEWEAL